MESPPVVPQFSEYHVSSQALYHRHVLLPHEGRELGAIFAVGSPHTLWVEKVDSSSEPSSRFAPQICMPVDLLANFPLSPHTRLTQTRIAILPRKVNIEYS
jgi:hypothetical protein